MIEYTVAVNNKALLDAKHINKSRVHALNQRMRSGYSHGWGSFFFLYFLLETVNNRDTFLSSGFYNLMKLRFFFVWFFFRSRFVVKVSKINLCRDRDNLHCIKCIKI